MALVGDPTRAVEDGRAGNATGPSGPGKVVIIGAGPAGLTAAYCLTKHGCRSTVVEKDEVPGGIARTVVRDGWRFDVGGHRFFTKVREVEDLWHEILGPDDLLVRPRLSRIYYGGKFFDYPIQIGNAVRGLGLVESARCGLSYLWVKVRRPPSSGTYEGWVAARFGWRLYRKFFKSYTEKVWGIPASEIQADWAAQRIKTLSMSRALLHSLSPQRKATSVTSLIEEFEYPRLGPGMMWERATELVRANGGEVRFSSGVERITRGPAGAEVVEVRRPGKGGTEQLAADHVISSMPLGELVAALDPSPPAPVMAAAKGLQYRDFLTIALVVPADKGFPDNWIYVHDPKVRLGRVQNFGSWSEEMVKGGKTCLGLEYFVFDTDELWDMADAELVRFGAAEIAAIGLLDARDVEAGYVVRMPKAYPVYDSGYDEKVAILRRFLESEVPNLHPVGRNGMHRYNNQDHSMLTALLTVENLFGQDYDTWSVNVESEYHEEQVGKRAPGLDARTGAGRSAPSVIQRA